MARRVAAVLLLLALGCLLGILLLCFGSGDTRGPPGFKYGIVLDAGSSHTAMFVYKWPADKENDTGVVSEHSMCDVQGPGISSYSSNPRAAGTSLVHCLTQALRDVPEEKHTGTPLYLGATAGMRLLNIANPQASDAVLSAVAATLKSYPFDFRGAKILSGEEEGVFGWVTANYLLENFIKRGWLGEWIQPQKKTLGAMDFGGASTQITFETRDTIEDPRNEVMLKLYGQEYKVYTHSFLCYGRDQVLKRLLSKLFQAEGYRATISHPCWPTGYHKSLWLSSVYDSPCTEKERPSLALNTTVTVAGTGNSSLCALHLSKLFNFTTCSFSHCSFDDTFQPEVSGKFIAFSAFFYTVDFIQTVMGKPVHMPSDLKDAAETICATSWSELLQKAPKLEKRLPDYCAVSTFVYLLTTKGYNFNNHSFPNIAFQKKAGETSIGWALGYMLNLTNMIPAEKPSSHKSMLYNYWVLLILLFVLSTLTSLVTAVCLLQRSKSLAI
ncbi:ectonucleoside triphosphate diphosphohydrolase 2 [Dryobates pubescens]|uniref:ectonucleoside triphosphate diphosphohydrolase 2 n=1 Tax=Dryobates pubescens TaxID=118200 RepID=UPI0023B97271|nr:ectonucleoside triphosphate diphosphohydrolase 2 [Dryobates pubescens]